MAKAMIMRILAKLFACSHLHALLSLCALKLARELQNTEVFFFSISDFCLILFDEEFLQVESHRGVTFVEHEFGGVGGVRWRRTSSGMARYVSQQACMRGNVA